MNLSKYIDHTLLKPDASLKDIERLCNEAINYGFYSVCVNPYRVDDCKRMLKGTDVKVCSVVGFPLGANQIEVKAFEVKSLIEKGVDEIDYVVNIGAVKDGNFKVIEQEMREIVGLAKPYNVVVKAIIEVPLLNSKEIEKVCKVLTSVDFVKTSTGFNVRPVTVEDVKILKKFVKEGVKIKAAGGIRSYKLALELVKAGASRLGCSRSVDLIKQSCSEEFSSH